MSGQTKYMDLEVMNDKGIYFNKLAKGPVSYENEKNKKFILYLIQYNK